MIYDEVYLPNSDAHEIARACQKKMQGVAFETFVIDYHAGRQTPMGFNKTVADQYSDAFRQYSLVSSATGSSFQWASDDLDGGCELVRTALHIGSKGRPWLRVVTGNCPAFVQMMGMYRKRMDANGFAEDKPAPRQIDPLCDCVRYWVAMQPQYLAPSSPASAASPTYQYFINEWKKDQEPKDESIHVGPGARPEEVLT